MKKIVLQVAAYVAAFFLTTGVVIPWLISNNFLPLPLIVLCVLSVIGLWVVFMENPLRLLYKFIKGLLDDQRE